MYLIKLRKGLAVSALAAVALVLAACSGSSATGNQPAPAVQATQALPAATEVAPAATPTVAAATTVVVTAEPTTAATTVATGKPMAPAATVEATATTAATATATVGPTAAATTATGSSAAVANPPATCTAGALTPALTEGPYYKANPPENSNLAGANAQGTRLTITGYVFNANCQPVPGARVDFWQADASGQYDNSGYNLRGYQLTDAQGRYTLTTVVPGLYPGRTRHIHVKVTTPDGTTLTTQLFFPNESQNSSDGIFAAQNVLNVQQSSSTAETATFNFVVNGK